MLTLPSSFLRFAADSKATMPESCCEKRKRGIPVECCPPLPLDQLELGDPDQVQGVSSEQRPNIVTRVIDWLKSFVQGFWADLKHLFARKA